MDNRSLSLCISLGPHSFSVGRGHPLRLLSATGLETSGYNVILGESSALDGGYINGRRVAARAVELELECADETTRALLLSAMTPKFDGVLSVSRGNVARKITFTLTAAEFSQPTLYTPARIALSLLCPDPYFTDLSDSTVIFRRTAPLLTFPFNSTAAGITSGYYTVGDTATIFNSGDTDIGIVCRLRANGGTVINPEVRSGGEYVRLQLALTDGEYADIDTRKGSKRVTVNGADSFMFDRTSVFFSLPVGTSVLSVDAGAGSQYLNAQLSYTLKYSGI